MYNVYMRIFLISLFLGGGPEGEETQCIARPELVRSIGSCTSVALPGPKPKPSLAGEDRDEFRSIGTAGCDRIAETWCETDGLSTKPAKG